MLRFSLRWLLSFVAFVAIGMLALRYASFFVSGCLSVAWQLFLMAAILCAIYRSQRRRAFWVGCCVFGWSFAAYGTITGVKTTAFDRSIESAYDEIKWSMKVAPATGLAHVGRGGRATFSGNAPATIFFPREKPFTQAAETLVSFVIAFVGGIVAQWLYATRDREGKETTNDPPHTL